jgi:hypothetical protein
VIESRHPRHSSAFRVNPPSPGNYPPKHTTSMRSARRILPARGLTFLEPPRQYPKSRWTRKQQRPRRGQEHSRTLHLQRSCLQKDMTDTTLAAPVFSVAVPGTSSASPHVPFNSVAMNACWLLDESSGPTTQLPSERHEIEITEESPESRAAIPGTSSHCPEFHSIQLQ